MPLGTLDRTPPPFFRQGLPARSKLAFFAALALFLMVADNRFQLATTLREALAIVLLPVQRTLLVPVQTVDSAGEYLQGLQRALQAERQARQALADQAEKVARANRLAAENLELRGLLGLRPMLVPRSLAAEVMYEAADPYSRKVFVSAGLTQGVRVGSPVIGEKGVLGQVTRVYALTSEVTLLSDREAAIPVLNLRTQQRGAAFGGIQGHGRVSMELRFVSPGADVQVGDVLQTSGVDGVYPPQLPVARIAAIDRRGDSSFMRVLLEPAAPLDAARHVLVLEPMSVQMPPRPEPPPAAGRGQVAVRPGAAGPAVSSAGGSAAASSARSDGEVRR